MVYQQLHTWILSVQLLKVFRVQRYPLTRNLQVRQNGCRISHDVGEAVIERQMEKPSINRNGTTRHSNARVGINEFCMILQSKEQLTEVGGLVIEHMVAVQTPQETRLLFEAEE